MTTGRDDALTWDGDDDPTLDLGSPAAPDGARPDDSESDGPESDGSESETSRAAGDDGATSATLPPGFTAVGKGSDAVGAEAAGDAASVTATASVAVAAHVHRPLGNAALIALGVLGGVYTLFAIGWLIGGLRLQGRAQYLVFDVMYQGSLWLAVLAPLLWFATTLLLTRRSRTWVRFAWLAAGVVLLLPWPFVMTGAIGQ